MSTVTTSLQRIQTDPQGENPVAVAFFSKATQIGNDTFVAPTWDKVSWSLTSSKKVSVNGVEYSYAEVSAAVTAIAYQELAEQTAPVEPTE